VTIRILYVGKARDEHCNALAAEYLKRSKRYARCEIREIDLRRINPIENYPAAIRVLLDPAGRSIDTAGLVELVRRAENEARDLVFILGGADGLPPGLKGKADLLLSLTPLTLPHEMARAILAEQVYRALTTLRGHPYPR
jgi:23S rRNA (pseudouridine1915-N3)-methyltransferase